MSTDRAALDEHAALTREDGLCIVLVEDQRRDEQLIAAHLAEGGLLFEMKRVETRADFERALSHSRCDVILSDYNVPGFEGPEALELARRDYPDTPFIFVSGALGEERAIELLKQGATDYVLKDKLERLGRSVQRALDEAHLREQRKRAEERLRQSEERSRALIAALTEGVLVHDAAGTIQDANASAQHLLGWPLSELRGKTFADPWWQAVREDGTPCLTNEAPALLALETGRGVVGEVLAFSRPDGSVVWLSVNAQPLFDKDGARAVGVVSSFSDITELKRRTEFEQQLIGIVSHDLRNPIGAVAMGAQLLQREPLSQGARTIAARIASSADRASRLVTDLLDFTQARLAGGIQIDRKSLDFHKVVRHVLEEIQVAWPKRELHLEQYGDGRGELDEDRLAQVTTNLVTNALRHGAADTPVRVRTWSEQHALFLAVHNQGRPIPPALIPRIFEAMQRGTQSAERPAHGVGLGLFIVDQIVRAHAGVVSVESTSDAGTTFTVRIPRGGSESGVGHGPA